MKDARENDAALNQEGGKNTKSHKNHQEEKALLKELVKNEFEKNRAELTKAKSEETTKAVKDVAKWPAPEKRTDRTDSPDFRRAKKALEHAIKSLTAHLAPIPIPPKIVANIIVPYAAIENVEKSNSKEKSKTQKKKKKATKQKKRIFRKLLKKALS
jgi:hypothetical protein